MPTDARQYFYDCKAAAPFLSPIVEIAVFIVLLERCPARRSSNAVAATARTKMTLINCVNMRLSMELGFSELLKYTRFEDALSLIKNIAY